MRSRCEELRERLTREAGTDRALEAHLERCPACARFAAGIESVREALRAHHAGVEPDAGFAGRVVTRLRRDPAEALGWAAARLLPATLVLLAVLLWIALQSSPSPDALVAQSPSDDPLAWVIADEARP